MRLTPNSRNCLIGDAALHVYITFDWLVLQVGWLESPLINWLVGFLQSKNCLMCSFTLKKHSPSTHDIYKIYQSNTPTAVFSLGVLIVNMILAVKPAAARTVLYYVKVVKSHKKDFHYYSIDFYSAWILQFFICLLSFLDTHWCLSLLTRAWLLLIAAPSTHTEQENKRVVNLRTWRTEWIYVINNSGGICFFADFFCRRRRVWSPRRGQVGAATLWANHKKTSFHVFCWQLKPPQPWPRPVTELQKL